VKLAGGLTETLVVVDRLVRKWHPGDGGTARLTPQSCIEVGYGASATTTISQERLVLPGPAGI